MKKIFKLLMITIAVFSINISSAQADSYEVTITNLTRGQIASPVFAVTHNQNLKLFNAGEPASTELAALAQDADTSGLDALLSASPNVLDIVSGSNVILPGGSETIVINGDSRNRFLSLVSMLVTTNDAFLAISQVQLPKLFANLTAYAYDAGAEANDESCAYIPGPPCDNPHLTSDVDAEGFVHIHAGIHGVGDLDAAQYDWRNPVAKILISRIRN